MVIDGFASSRRPSHATIACPTCGVYQPVEIDYEGHQGCAALPAAPCPVCHRDLCCFCDQVECECGKVVCLDCTAVVPDGTPSGLRLCKPCAQADPLCPACAQFACMIPRENSEQQWFECSACGAAMDGDEIDSVQPATAARRQPGVACEQERGGMHPEAA